MKTRQKEEEEISTRISFEPPCKKIKSEAKQNIDDSDVRVLDEVNWSKQNKTKLKKKIKIGSTHVDDRYRVLGQNVI